MFKSIFCKVSLAVIAVSFVPLPAQAETVSKSVRHADLDLTSPSGQATLERRVRQAVGQVCGRHAGGNLRYLRQIRACRENAELSARPQISVAIARAERRGEQRLASTR